MVERIQEVLKERAVSVRVTHRLTDSPASGQRRARLSTNLESLLKASGQKVPAMKPSSKSTRAIRLSSG